MHTNIFIIYLELLSIVMGNFKRIDFYMFSKKVSYLLKNVLYFSEKCSYLVKLFSRNSFIFNKKCFIFNKKVFHLAETDFKK